MVRSRIPPGSMGVPPSMQSALRVAAAFALPLGCLLAGAFGTAFPLVAAVTLAALLVLMPPSSPSPRWLVWPWLLLALVPLLALLPAQAVGVPEWRRTLVEDFSVPLGGPLAPDVHAFAAALVQYWTGLGYLWWICGQQWDRDESLALGRMFLFVITALAIIVIVWKVLLAAPLPGILGGKNPILQTRNQLATILAMGCAGGIAAAAASFKSPVAVFGGAASLVCFCALAALGSRAGVLMAALGVAVALAVVGLIRRSRLFAMTAVALPLAGLAFILFAPGETAMRIRESGNPLADFRFAVQSDALDMLAEQPLTGVGLGNFDGVFPFFREASRNHFRAAHPESDYLWLANEAGVIAVLLAAAAAVGMVLGWWRLARSDHSLLEPAALAFSSLTVVAAHGCLDVPGHSMLTWTMLAGLVAAASSGSARPVALRPSRLVPATVAFGLATIALAGFLFDRETRPRPFANDTPLDQIAESGQIETWMQKHPLDAQVVEIRAHRLVADGRYREASRAFALMERLTPFEPQFLERSTRVWAQARQPREFARAWVRLLQILPPHKASEQASRLIAQAESWPQAAGEFALLNPPLGWSLQELGIDERARIRMLADLCSTLARHGKSRDACRIVIFQIGPSLGEHPPRIALSRSRFGIETFSARPDPLDSWYDAGVNNFRARQDQRAWRLLRTYLAHHLGVEE